MLSQAQEVLTTYYYLVLLHAGLRAPPEGYAAYVASEPITYAATAVQASDAAEVTESANADVTEGDAGTAAAAAERTPRTLASAASEDGGCSDNDSLQGCGSSEEEEEEEDPDDAAAGEPRPEGNTADTTHAVGGLKHSKPRPCGCVENAQLL